MTKTTDRKFDTWEWRDESTAPKALEFEVRCERPVNVAEGPIRYYIKHTDPPLHVEAGDLGPLRDKLDAAVRAFYKVDWQPVLIVRVQKGPAREAEGFTMALEVIAYERGVLNGKTVHRQKRPTKSTEGSHNFSYAMKQGDIDREFREFGRTSQPQRQWVLPDTIESRDMLRRFDAAAADLLGLMLDGLGSSEPTGP